MPITALMDTPPKAPTNAFRRRKPLSPDGKDFSPAADRLHEVTTALLSGW